MRDAAWERFAAAVGRTSELSEVESQQTDAEFRELGLIP
jgi:hypothetical protein